MLHQVLIEYATLKDIGKWQLVSCIELRLSFFLNLKTHFQMWKYINGYDSSDKDEKLFTRQMLREKKLKNIQSFWQISTISGNTKSIDTKAGLYSYSSLFRKVCSSSLG